MSDEPRNGRGPKPREDVVFRSVSNDWVLYDPRTRDLHVLNATAAAVWSCCDGQSTARDIARALADALVDPPDFDVLVRDVEAALDRFHAQALFE